jgi:hypothetical protein
MDNAQADVSGTALPYVVFGQQGGDEKFENSHEFGTRLRGAFPREFHVHGVLVAGKRYQIVPIGIVVADPMAASMEKRALIDSLDDMPELGEGIFLFYHGNSALPVYLITRAS